MIVNLIHLFFSKKHLFNWIVAVACGTIIRFNCFIQNLYFRLNTSYIQEWEDNDQKQYVGEQIAW